MRACVLKQNPSCYDRVSHFFCLGGGWYLGLLGLLLAVGAALLGRVTELRDQRDAARLDLEQSQSAVEAARADLAASEQKLHEVKSRPVPQHNRPYLVISLTDRSLWYKQGGELLLSTRVATGSGKTLARKGSAKPWKFETPRGRLTVQSKEVNPLWAPPDWYYVEQAKKRNLALVRLDRGNTLHAADGSVIRVAGTDVVRDYPGGRRSKLKAADGCDIVVDGKLLMPPLKTRQRQFDEVLGSHRLKLDRGIALHGTNRPESVGQAVSHGCLRLLNQDIEKLYRTVPVGTPVYIY